MKTTVRLHDFVQAFQDAGRGDQFTLTGLIDLFQYLEEFEQDIGEELELDVIQLCCEFTEYADLAEIQDVYPDIEDIEHLEYNTQVIVANNSIIIRDY